MASLGTKTIAILWALASAISVAKPLNVVTSTTDLAWAMRELGGANVEVRSLLKGPENPHYVDAVPEFVRLAAEADIVCVVGLDLEVGWMPKVLARSGNAKVQPGGKGYCEAAKAIEVLEKPTGPVDRSMGDVHPAGNPHFWLSPPAMALAAKSLKEVLIGTDPTHVADYIANYDKLVAKLKTIETKMNQKLAAIPVLQKKPSVLEYHKEFSYYFAAYHILSAGTVEEKPGIAPSAGRLAEVALRAKAENIRAVLAADTAPKSVLEQFESLSGAKTVRVPVSIKPGSAYSDYESLQMLVTDKLVEAFGKSGNG